MDAQEKAFDFAQDTTKQVLGLSSGIVALTVTFLNGHLQSYGHMTRTVLEIAWYLYAASILCGVVTLMGLSGNLERPGKTKDGTAKEPSIYVLHVRVFSIPQMLTFLAAVGCTLWFAARTA